MRIGVFGASGRMGQAVLQELPGSDAAAAIVHGGSAKLGERATEQLVYIKAADLNAGEVDVLIDFSLPAALTDNLSTAKRLSCPLVVCTTGLTAEQQQQLTEASHIIPLLYAANTSVGINLLESLVALTSRVMATADIEIFEAHHQHKRDAPSGTALVLGEAAARGRGKSLAEVTDGIRGADAVDGSEQPRQPGQIGFASIRAADIIGEHTVYVANAGERIELTHRVSDRRIFACGAIQAAEWLAGQPKGFYKMADMLNLKQALQALL